MRSFWRWTGTIFFALAFIFLVLTGIGTSLPIDHRAVCGATFSGPARYLYREIADDPGSAQWRPDIASVVLVSGSGPTAVWRETDSHGNAKTYRTTVYVVGRRLARTIDYAPGMPFAGTWTFALSFTPSESAAGRRLPIVPALKSSTDRKTMIELDAKVAMDRLWLATYGPPGVTRVTITEDGKIYNPFFRFLSRYVFGYTKSMQTYLRDLATDLRQTPQVSCATDV